MTRRYRCSRRVSDREEDACRAADQQRELEQTESQINATSQQMMQQSYGPRQQQLSDYGSQTLAAPWPSP